MSPTSDPIPSRHTIVAREPRQCQHHGTFEAKLWAMTPPVKMIAGKGAPKFCDPFWSNCPTCDGEWQQEADARDAEVRGGMTAKQRMAAARVAAAGIPPRFASSTLWTWQHGMDQQRRVWDWARDYAHAFEDAIASGRSGVFCGAPGTGKTHLAIGVLRHVLERGGTGIYTTVMDMLGRIKATFHERAHETEQQVMDALTSCDLIVIDEVGRSLDTNYELAQFFRVLDRRYQNLRPTILVTNLPKSKLLEFVGDAVVDRLRENGGAMLMFDWASQRATKARP